MKSHEQAADLLGRLLISAIFILSGFNKIGGYDGTAGYMESQGVPGALLPAVIAVELGGGLLILLGLWTRQAALALAGFCLAAAVLFHSGPNDLVNYLKNFAIAGGLLFLFAHGAGAYSLDARRRRPTAALLESR